MKKWLIIKNIKLSKTYSYFFKIKRHKDLQKSYKNWKLKKIFKTTKKKSTSTYRGQNKGNHASRIPVKNWLEWGSIRKYMYHFGN